MANHVNHFAIHADDVERARAFYEACFGWTFTAWGPPEFYLIEGAGIRGALQRRRTPVTGDGMIGFECTIGVDDVDATAAAVEEHGGKVVMQKMQIPSVGWLIHFQDTEGNLAGAMKYERNGA